MTQTGTIFDIKRFAIHDGPGIRTTVFLKGCPLNCAWCHNPESRAREPEPRGDLSARACLPVAAVSNGQDGHLIGRIVTAASVLDIVRRDAVFYDQSGGGMTLSGGEPLIQPAFAAALLAGARAEGFHTAVDTSGAVSWRHFEAVIPYTDLFLYDLKLADPAAHKEWVGVDPTPIRENLARLLATGAAIRIRVPLIPDITDTDANLSALADVVAGLGAGDGVCGKAGAHPPLALDLLPYNPAGEHKTDSLGMPRRLEKRMTQSAAELERIRRHFDHLTIPVSLGGA
jgi:pyruvate formate lyase activating enzyme